MNSPEGGRLSESQQRPDEPSAERPTSHAQPPRRRLVVWGTYDTSKPKVRILLDGIRLAGFDVVEIHRPVWDDVRDKGTLSGWGLVRIAGKWIGAMPGLLLRYLRAPTHDLVLVPYFGLMDLFVLWPLARYRRARIAWDQFIPIHDTVVHDRRLLAPWNPIGGLLFAVEWLAVRLADLPFLDTDVHARRFEQTMGLTRGRVGAVPLGTSPDRFPPRSDGAPPMTPFRVIFYGQYIRLHGLETIVRAAKLVEDRGVPTDWLLVGDGQERPLVDRLIADLAVTNIRQPGWVTPDELPGLVHGSDAGLGIFGTTSKALNVIPNKVYELASMQVPIITGDTPAMREFAPRHPAIHLVPPGDPDALASCVLHLASQPRGQPFPALPVIGPPEVGAAFRRLVERGP